MGTTGWRINTMLFVFETDMLVSGVCWTAKFRLLLTNILELDKFVYLINNLQRDDIAFLVKGLTKRRNYLNIWRQLPLNPLLYLCYDRKGAEDNLPWFVLYKFVILFTNFTKITISLSVT